MSFAQLTRDEARRRSDVVSVQRYEIDLDLTDGRGGPARETFRSRTSVTFRANAAETFIDLMPRTVTEAVLNDVAIGTDVVDGRMALTGLRRDNRLLVDAQFELADEHQGLQRLVDPADGETYFMSMTFMAGAQRIFCCFDQPDLKAEIAVRVTAPAGWEVLANGAVEHVEASTGGARTWSFATTPPLPTYVTAVICGPLHRVTRRLGPVELGLACARSAAELLDTEYCFRYTEAGLELFQKTFGTPYPYRKYDQVFTLEPGDWAMENAGLVTFGAGLLFGGAPTEAEHEQLAYTMLHELAHMWFGNLVTMRWWDDSWLNESFATYAGHLATAEGTEHSAAWIGFAQREKQEALAADQRTSTHPVSTPVPDLHTALSNFDAITYQKGAAVLRQLVAFVGRSDFDRGMHRHLTAHAHGNASLTDLLDALEASSGRNLHEWAEQWLRRPGVSTLRPEIEVDDRGVITAFHVVQSAPSAHPVLRSHRTTVGCYAGDPELRRTAGVELDIVGERTAVPQLVGIRAPKLVIVNDHDLTYAKIRFDERSATTLLVEVDRIVDPLARSVAWSALWDMTRDGEIAAADYVETVLRGAGRVGEHAVLVALLRNAAKAVRDYCPAPIGAALAQRLAGLAYEQVQQRPAGDALRTIWLRGFAEIGPGTTMADEVRQLYDAAPDLDFETRWRLVLGLAPYGRAGAADIEAEYVRDANGTSADYAATARALLPTAAAKAAAWALVTAPDDEQVSRKFATARGFWHGAQLDLLLDYVPAYFAGIERSWSFDNGGERARAATEALAPTLVHSDVVRLGEAWLARDGRPDALRRVVADTLDDTRRSLRNRSVPSRE